MFKKYYKDANNDIRADEAFINSVIENAHTPKTARRIPYYSYALTAAAVMVISVTAIALPMLTNNSDDGVITVVTETVKPSSTSAPTAAPVTTAKPKASKSEKTDKTEKSEKAAEKASKSQASDEKPVTETEAGEQSADVADDRLSLPTALPETKKTAASVFKSAPALKSSTEDTTEAADEYVTSDRADTVSGSPEADKGTTAGGAVGSLMSDYKYYAAPYILPPTGYYTVLVSEEKTVFMNNSGEEITITYSYTDLPDSAPVYTETGASLVLNGKSYSISGAERAAIEELVNSLK